MKTTNTPLISGQAPDPASTEAPVHVAFVRPGARDGLTVAQGVGDIAPDYPGDILVMLRNTSGEERRLRRGERMAQLIFQPYVRPAWQEVPELAVTRRGAGGFGHTGR